MELKPGLYYHYKDPSKLYRLIGIAKHSETDEDLVIYEAQYDNPVSKHWARPLKIFLGEVEVEGKMVPRFTWVGE